MSGKFAGECLQAAECCRQILSGKMLEDHGQVGPSVTQESHVGLLRKHPGAELWCADKIRPVHILFVRHAIRAQRCHIFQMRNDKPVGKALKKLFGDKVRHGQ